MEPNYSVCNGAFGLPIVVMRGNEMGRTTYLIFIVITAAFLAGCGQAESKVRVFERSLSCGMTTKEVGVLAKEQGAELIPSGSPEKMMQVQYPPEELLVFFGDKGTIQRVDRAKITYLFFDLFPENVGYYGVMNCG